MPKELKCLWAIYNLHTDLVYLSIGSIAHDFYQLENTSRILGTEKMLIKTSYNKMLIIKSVMKQ